MNCERFFERLDDFVEGRLSATDARLVREHLETCPRCEELAATFTDDSPDEQPASDLADMVMMRTSGSPCYSAHERLGDHVDDLLEPVDRDLVASHVAHCRDCAELVRVISRMQETLPLMAEMEPDTNFVVDVLNATSRQPQLVDRWAARIAETFRSLLQRPRIAWEGAYIGTFVLVLLFGTPTSPLARVPQQALEIAGVNPVAELRPPVAELEQRVSAEVHEAWGWVDGKMENASRESTTALERIKRDLGTLWERVTSDQETQDNSTQGENE